MNFIKSIYSNETLLYYISSFVVKSFQILILFLYARYIAVGDLGSFYLLTFASTILSYVFFGNANTTVKHFMLREGVINIHEIIGYSISFILVSSLIFVFIAVLFNITYLYYSFAIILGLSIFTENLLLGLKRYYSVTLLNFSKVILELTLFSLFFFLDFSGITIRVYPYLMSLLIPTVFIVLFNLSGIQLDISMFNKTIFYIARFSLPLLVHTLLFIIVNQSTRVMVDIFYSKELTGYYSVIQSFANVIILVSMFYNSILVDKLYCFLKNDDQNEIKKLVNIYVQVLSIISVVIYVFLIHGLKFFLQEDYHEYFFIVTSIFCFNSLYIFYTIFSVKMNFYQKGFRIAILSFSAVLFGFILNFYILRADFHFGVISSLLIYNVLLFLFYFDTSIMKLVEIKTFLFCFFASLLIFLYSLFINVYFAIFLLFLSLVILNSLKWKKLF